MSYCKVNFRFYFLSNPTTLPLPRSFCYAPTLPTAILLVNLQSIRKRSKKCVVQSFVFLPIPALLPLPLPPPPPQKRRRTQFSFFFPHVSRAQRLARARIRTRVVRLGAQCTDHWTTEQSRGIGAPAIQLTTHVKSSTL